MRRWRCAAPPLIVGLVGLGLWELAVRVGRIAPVVLPSPSAIGEQLWLDRGGVLRAGLASGAHALVGLLAGASLALVAALVISRLRGLADVAVPLGALAGALPLIVLVPVLDTMVDPGVTPRRIVVAIVAFLPVFVSTLRGLREIDPVHRDLMDSLAASGWTVTRLVRLPAALPSVLAGLRQASSLAVVTAVVSEYFGGLQDGLGARITAAAAVTAHPRAWAFAVAACVLGLIFHVGTLVAGRVVTALVARRVATPWRRRGDAGSADVTDR